MKADEIKRERTLTRLSVISLVAAVVIVFVLIVCVMIRYGIITPPAVFGNMFGPDVTETDAETGDYSAMLAALSDKPSPDYFVRHDVTEEECAELFHSLVPSDKYTVTYSVNIYSADGKTERNRNVQLWKCGGLYRVEVTEEGSPVSLTVCDGSEVKVTDYRGGESSVSYKPNGYFTAESSAGIPDLKSVIDTAFAENSGCSISLTSDGDETLYMVSYPNPSLTEQTETYYISVKYGIFVRADTSLNGKLIYSMSAVSFYPDLLGNTDELFG